ncbi:mechanosensitive ion channel family protein [soil metagenome]|jgi:small-conductance mechanosensitive channel|nr:mechanosensitive ion channel family protein [Acidobacteriota bacterium]
MHLLLFQDAKFFDLDVMLNSVASLVSSFLKQLPYIVVGLIVFLLFWYFAHVVRRVTQGIAKRSTHIDDMLADLFGRIGSALFTILGVFVAAVIIFPTFKPGDLIAGLGITSIAVGFAFKDVLQNFFAGILILWRRPFVVGDQIRVKEYEGTVEEITVRSTRLKTYDGERAIMPNGDVYTSAVLVRTAYQTRRVRFMVGIGYLDDIEKGRQTIRRVLDKTEGVLKNPGPWIYISELAPSSVNFTVYFWTDSQQANVLMISDKVATGIKYALDEAGIDMPYPHTVVLFHDATGSRDGDIKRNR